MTHNIKTKVRVRDIFYVCLTGTALLIAAFSMLGLENKEPQIFLLYVLQEITLFVSLYFLVVRKYDLGLADFGWIKVIPRSLVKTLLKALGIFIIITIFFHVLELVAPNFPGASGGESLVPSFGTKPIQIVSLFVLAVIVAPVLEEIFFRGFIFNTLLNHYSFWPASIVSALIFTLAHMDMGSFFIIFALSLLLNWIYSQHRSIIPGIYFHMINNSIALIFELVFLAS